ncbi:hypothetical protein EJ08DRAFT_728135, partial [Tothia fuscella]
NLQASRPHKRTGHKSIYLNIKTQCRLNETLNKSKKKAAYRSRIRPINLVKLRVFGRPLPTLILLKVRSLTALIGVLHALIRV